MCLMKDQRESCRLMTTVSACFAIWMGKSTAVNFLCYVMGLQDPLGSKFNELITPANTAFKRSIDVWTYGLSRAPSALGSTENICRIQSLQTVRKTKLTFLAYDNDEKNGWKAPSTFLEFHYFFVPCFVSSLSCPLLRKFLQIISGNQSQGKWKYLLLRRVRSVSQRGKVVLKLSLRQCKITVRGWINGNIFIESIMKLALSYIYFFKRKDRHNPSKNLYNSGSELLLIRLWGNPFKSSTIKTKASIVRNILIFWDTTRRKISQMISEKEELLVASIR